jgi:uncharacterized protein (DUF58 family)
MNRKFIFLLGVIYLLILFAILAQSASLALFSLPLLTYLGLGWWMTPDHPKIKAVRHAFPTRTTAGSPIEVLVDVENFGAATLDLQVADPCLPNMRLLSGGVEKWVVLPSGGSATLRYTFTAERGSFTWQSVHIVVSDPLDLFPQTIQILDPIEVLVLPRRRRLRTFQLRTRRTLPTSGPVPSRRSGIGIDFWGVREYQPGDPMRSIDWRKTAHQPGHFYTKEFEREQIADIGLVLDARLRTELDIQGASLFEYSTTVTAALAETFSLQGNRIGLLVFGDRILRLYPGYGKYQLNRIMTMLSRASVGTSSSIDTLRYIPVRLFPSHSTLILVSPLDLFDYPAYARLKAAGYQVILISPDPVDFEFKHLPAGPINRLAFRAARIEREVLLRRLRRAGVGVIDWQVDQPMANTIRTALQKVTQGVERK